MSENSFKIREKFINKLVDKLEDFNSDLILLAKVDKKIYKKNNSQKGGAKVNTIPLEFATYVKKDELEKQQAKIDEAVIKAGTLTAQIDKINRVLKEIQEQIEGFNITPPDLAAISLDVDSLTEEEIKAMPKIFGDDRMRYSTFANKYPRLATAITPENYNKKLINDAGGYMPFKLKDPNNPLPRVPFGPAKANLKPVLGRSSSLLGTKNDARRIGLKVSDDAISDDAIEDASSVIAEAERKAGEAARTDAVPVPGAARADAVVAAGDNGESEEDVANSITSDAINEAVVRAAATDSDATPDTTPDATPGAATGVAPVPGNKGKLKDEFKEARMTVKAANALIEGGKDRNRSEMNATFNNVTLPKGNPRFPTLNVGRATGSSTPGAAPGAPPDNIFSPLLDNSTPVATSGDVTGAASSVGNRLDRAVGKVSAVNSLIEGGRDEEKRSANKRAQ